MPRQPRPQFQLVRSIEHPSDIVMFGGYHPLLPHWFIAHWDDGDTSLEKVTEWEPITGKGLSVTDWPERSATHGA